MGLGLGRRSLPGGGGVEGNIVHYMDPGFGEGLKSASYDWVVSGSNHTWTDSQRMTTFPMAGHDLTGVMTLKPLKCGKTCKLTGTLKIDNTGTDAPPFYVHFFIKNGSQYSPLQTASVGAIKAQASKVVKLKAPPLSFDPLGMYLVAFIDSSEEISEPAEENMLVMEQIR